MGDIDELQFIAREIEKTGYPLEIEISTILEKRNWRVAHSTFYNDMDTQTLREIDIRADMSVDSIGGRSLAPYKLHALMNIQCKKSEPFAWVFFLRPNTRQDLELGPLFLDYLHTAKTSSIYLHNVPQAYPPGATPPPTPILSAGVARTIKDTRDLGIVSSDTFANLSALHEAKTYKEVKRKRYEKDTSIQRKESYSTIYEAAITVAKATQFDWSNAYNLMHLQMQSVAKAVIQRPDDGFGDIQIYVPTVVFEGELLFWQDQKIERTNAVLLHVFPSAALFPPLKIAVVKKEYFANFVSAVENDLTSLAKVLLTKKQMLNEQRDFLTRELGQPMT